MKQLLAIIILLGIGITSFAKDVEITDIKLSEFSSLDISSGFEVELKHAPESTLKIVVDEQYLPHLVMEVKDATLFIGLQDLPRLLMTKPSFTRKAYITMPFIDEIDLSTAASLRSEDLFQVRNIDIELSSAASLVMNIEGQDLDLDVSSAAYAKLNIKMADILVEGSSAAYVLLEGSSTNLVLGVSSASDIRINGEFENIVVEASSASGVHLKGKTNLLNIEASSSAFVHAASMPANSVNVEGSSMASISVLPLSHIRTDISRTVDLTIKNENFKVDDVNSGITWD